MLQIIVFFLTSIGIMQLSSHFIEKVAERKKLSKAKKEFEAPSLEDLSKSLTSLKSKIEKENEFFDSKDYKKFKKYIDLIKELKEIHFKGVFNTRLEELLNDTISLYEANLKSIALFEKAETKKFKLKEEKETLYKQNKKIRAKLKGLIQELIKMENSSREAEDIFNRFEESLSLIIKLKESREAPKKEVLLIEAKRSKSLTDDYFEHLREKAALSREQRRVSSERKKEAELNDKIKRVEKTLIKANKVTPFKKDIYFNY